MKMNEMNLQEIKEMIPHREPFLFIDKVLSWKNDEIIATKTFSQEDFFFKGHFPGNPIVPGAILMEAMGQASAILSKMHQSGLPEESYGYLVKVKNFTFKKKICQDDEITIFVKLQKDMGYAFIYKGVIKCKDDLAAEGEITIMIEE